MNKAYKYRIYPNKQQAVLIDKTIGCCRFLYNVMLSDKIDCYKATETMLYNTPAMYKGFYEFLKDIDSLALANIQLNLERAYKNFFTMPKTGFPKFKSKHKSSQKYTTNNLGQIYFEGGKIRLPKLGLVKVVKHRECQGEIKSVTVSKTKTGKYYVSVLCEYENQVEHKPISSESKMVGLDYSSSNFFVSSDGEFADMPHYFRESEKQLVKEQRMLSLKQKRGKNYGKQKIKVAKVHEKISNQRTDWLHKKSSELVKTYDCIFVEDINMKSISRSLRLGKATLDNAYGRFREFLEYKSKEQGKYLVKINKFCPTTKLCHICGYKYQDITLSIKDWTCPDCKTWHHRDINAAINILQFGKEIINGGRDDRSSLAVFSRNYLE